ncbi:hypothetical protein [Streptomyces sp. NPDC060031]|uniref:hypothetical protein n=1 Tax=Streptomyces sp. NPDC060031 TaxID=3347043 RepID=UPI0036895AE3
MHSKGVGAVTVAAPHVYCVEITNQDVDLSRAIVAATPRDHAGSTLRAIACGCANGKGVSVAAYAHTGAGQATGFYLAVLWPRRLPGRLPATPSVAHPARRSRSPP